MGLCDKTVTREGQIMAVLKYNRSMPLWEMGEEVRDTGEEAPHIKDSFHAQERSVIDARAIFMRRLLPMVSVIAGAVNQQSGV